MTPLTVRTGKSVSAKICGLKTPEAVSAAVEGDAAYIGLVFYEKSPRNITAAAAADLARLIPADVRTTGVFVDPTDEQLHDILTTVPLDLIQLHGAESPDRVGEVRTRFSLPVIKAFAIAGPDDIKAARDYQNVADMLLFDAKAPTSLQDALPGGNGLIFDWRLIREADWRIPWMLSGGLNAENIRRAVATSGATIVDVSSGVESRPGRKDIGKIKAFLKAVNEDRI